MKIYTTRLEGTDTRPALTVTYVFDAPPPEPGLIRIALVSPARFAGGTGSDPAPPHTAGWADGWARLAQRFNY
ncbi:hypothetical protein K4749_26725 [Streptomyces sp. TRM72054]|uniref:hypothetical protein n=1 Tax=Streptomyces sp. TRM72054 TaxID=2870562 RepID=UPI001C8C64B0|nr:hypothetical protein [Streptomyces sp. TRM72054]MBX9397093.1 hypothetical protein [Streptomyces sp. TRM72054]